MGQWEIQIGYQVAYLNIINIMLNLTITISQQTLKPHIGANTIIKL